MDRVKYPLGERKTQHTWALRSGHLTVAAVKKDWKRWTRLMQMIQSRKFDSSLSWKTLLAKCFKSPESWPGHCQFDTMVQISTMIEYIHIHRNITNLNPQEKSWLNNTEQWKDRNLRAKEDEQCKHIRFKSAAPWIHNTL